MRILVFFALILVCYGSQAQGFNLEIKGKLAFNEELSDIWGYVDEEDNEYALVGRNFGLGIYDVTDPDNISQKFVVPGPYSVWRDIKTWGDYCYVTCESGPGLLIVDMSGLPGNTNLPYTYYNGDTMTFQSAHNLYIDENGYAYLFGANYSMGGALILDLNNDPMDPEVVGIYDQNYFHDGVVRGDTLWGSAVYTGDAQVVDVSDKANPELLSSWKTPGVFTHNMWFSDDNNYVFTTDEMYNGVIAAYDVSDIYNPTLVDQWKVNDTNIIPHNTHFINNFLVTSHYTIGLNIIDVSRPHNMIETGRYDTSPIYNYEGFHGCWGVYPWLPSGNILATDMETGLYVFEPTYVRGCFLEGAVTDEHTGDIIFFPTINVIEDSLTVDGDILGEYATATMNAGTYTVEVSADGYFSKSISGVELINGELTELDVQLSNWPAGVEEKVKDEGIAVYPNPASTIISLRTTQIIEGVELITIDGKSVQAKLNYQGSKAADIDVSALASGVYTLKVQFSDKELTRMISVL